jgi:hypothetical protein
MTVQLIPIEAHERTVGQIFSDAFAFEIPAYQRPYAWEVDQVRELLDDLLDAMDNSSTSGGVYFLGSIVLIKSPNDPQSKVIDGQQRLTTLTILLSVLRDLTVDEERRFDRRAYIFQKANADRGTSDRFRLLLRSRDRAFFLRQVQQPGATNTLPDLVGLEGSQYSIAENTRFLRERLEAVDEKRRDALVAFVVQRCYLVAVAVPTAEAARRIFTVLNARGLDLTPTDILKADLLDRAGEPQEADLAERWEAVELATGRDGLVELFGHIRMLFEREKPRLALEAGFPKFVTPFKGDADQFISDLLEPLADAFTLLSDPKTVQQQFGLEAAKAVRSLARIDNKDWLPPALLWLWKRKPNQNEIIAGLLTRLERLAYFLFVTRRGVNDRIVRFAAVMSESDQQGTQQPSSLDLTEAEQSEFVNALNGPIYLTARICKPVLQRLDEALSSGGASYDDLVSIEHVLPQSVNDQSEWATLFPDEDQRSDWTHRIANLIFLTKRINIRASNWDFEKKKTEYFSSRDGASPFVITQDVLRTKNWTLEHLVERQKRLLEKLAAVWKLDISKGLPVEDLQQPRPPRDQTDSKFIAAKREIIMKALSQREKVDLVKISGAQYESTDGRIRAICTTSTRYKTGSQYWYGYSPEWNEFLSECEHSFLVLGCMDRNFAYALPRERVIELLKNLHRTSERHWHIKLEENQSGSLDLIIPRSSNISLAQFQLNF